MSHSVREAVLAQYSKTLRMPALAREYPALARQAREEGWDYEDFLRDLLEAEIVSRQERASERRLKEARLITIWASSSQLEREVSAQTGPSFAPILV